MNDSMILKRHSRDDKRKNPIDSPGKSMNAFEISKRLSIRHLRSFIAVSAHQSLTRAAGSLFVTQSALSATIQHLEADLGLRLFERTTRKVVLTVHGRALLPVASRLVDDFERALGEIQALGSNQRGRIGIAAAPSMMMLLLSKVAPEFIERNPSIDLYFREENAEGIQKRVRDGDVDFGLGGLWGENGDVAFTPLLEDRYGVVMCRNHPLAAALDGAVTLSWDALAPYDVVGYSADLGMQRQLTHNAEVSQAVREPRYRVSNTAIIATLLENSTKVAVISALAAKRAPLDVLTFRLLAGPALSRTVGLLSRRERSLSPAARAMVQALRRTLPVLARTTGVTLHRQAFALREVPDPAGD